MALSELRLPPETETQTVAALLPAPIAQPEEFDLSSAAIPYAAALAGACPRLSLRANLLPPDMRATNARGLYIPTLVLASLLVLGLVALALYSAYEDRKYLAALNTEIHRLEPVARKPMALEKATTAARQRATLLDSFRKRSKADLDALNELTHILPPPGWAMSLELTRDAVRVNGETDQAAGLLRVVDQSPLFEGSDFAQPIARTPSGETYSIRARREGIVP